MAWRRRWFYIGVVSLIVDIFFIADFKTDLSAFFIAGESAEEILLANEMQSGALSSRYIVSVSSEAKASLSSTFISQFKSELAAIEGIIDVWIPGKNTVAIAAVQKLYVPHAGQIYSLEPEFYLDKILTKNGLQDRAAILKKLLLSPQAPIIKKIARQDPLLLSLAGFESVRGQFKGVLKKDQRYQNLILQTEPAGLDIKQQKRIQKQIKKVFSDLVDNQDHIYSLAMTGVPVFAVRTQQLMQGDITKVSIISSVLITLLFIWVFRSYKTLLWTALLMVAVVSSAVFVTQLVFGYVHGITLAVGSTLIGICIDYPIHALVHSQAVAADQRTDAISRIWPSMMLGGLTTLIGYVALGFSGYPGFQQIAVYAGTGILVSLLLTRYVLPAFFGKQKIHRPTMLFAKTWIGFCLRYRMPLLIVVMLLLGLSLSNISKLRWIEDMQQLTPELDQLKENDRMIRSRMLSSIEPGRFVLVSGHDIENALQLAEQVYQKLNALKIKGQLHEFYGLYPWLLSRKQQQINFQTLQDRLDEKTISIWKKALVKHGLSVSRLGRLEYPETEFLTLSEISDSPVKRFIENQLVVSDQRVLILIWLAKHQPEALDKAFLDIPSVQYFSQRDLLNRMAGEYQQRAQISLLIGLAVIILLLLMRYKNLRVTFQTLSPAIFAAFFILAGWVYTGQAVSFLHLVGFLLAVAICVDYGIFYRENRSGNIVLTYQAMAASMLTSSLAFGCLAIADTSALQTLAQVVTLGIVVGFLLCPVIIHPTNE